MTNKAPKALMLPFQRGNIPLPTDNASLLGINILPDNTLEELIPPTKIDIIQPWATPAKALKAKGANLIETTSTASLPKNKYDYALFLPTKHREENLGNFAIAIDSLKIGGTLITAAPNQIGAGRIEKTLRKIMPKLENISKYKCRCFWAKKTGAENTKNWLDYTKKQPILNGNYQSQQGLFGWNKIDKGSAILAANLPQNLSGIGADFGCGYGWLATKALKSGLSLKEIHLIDADKRAVNLATENLSNRTQSVKIIPHWHDLQTTSPINNLDWIIMNPPFHEGKEQKASLGQSLLATAAKALKPNGTLYMVANNHLPYEKTAKELFKKTEKIIEKDGFKVLKMVAG